MTKIFFIKFLIVLAPLLLFFFLLWHHIVPLANKVVAYDLSGEPSPYIQSLLPSERVKDGQLLSEPVYFSVFPPAGIFSKVKVQLEFVAGERSLLEIGGLRDVFTQAYDFKTLANARLQSLVREGWLEQPVQAFGKSFSLFTRHDVSSADLSKIDNARIATYKVSLPWAQPDNFAANDGVGRILTADLRGSVEMFIYLPDKRNRTLSFSYIDQNIVEGADEITIRLFNKEQEILAQSQILDDGITEASKIMSKELVIDLSSLLSGLPEGVYRLVFSTTSDVIFKTIKTPSAYLAIKNNFSLITKDDQAMVWLTNARTVTAEPLSAPAVGLVAFNEQLAGLAAVGEKTKLKNIESSEVTKLVLNVEGGPGGLIKLTGEGFFTPASHKFFAPEPSGLANFLTAPEFYDVLLADVPVVTVNDNTFSGQAKFSLGDLALENGAYKFALSAPLINEPGGDIKIKKIYLTFTGEASWRRVYLSLRHFFKELIF